MTIKHVSIGSMTNFHSYDDEEFPSEGSSHVIRREDLLDINYPSNSIYFSSSNTNPSSVFGGTWELLDEGYLLGGETNYLYAFRRTA